MDSEFIVKLYRTFQVQTEAESYHYFVMHFEKNALRQTSQELRMLSSVTLYCQVTKIVMDSGSQLSEL